MAWLSASPLAVRRSWMRQRDRWIDIVGPIEVQPASSKRGSFLMVIGLARKV
jgi:hypothetical protein